MNEISTIVDGDRMTSLQIAEITGKPHNDVMKAIRPSELSRSPQISSQERGGETAASLGEQAAASNHPHYQQGEHGTGKQDY